MKASLPSALVSLTFLVSASMPVVRADGQLVNDTGCDCFLTNGTNVAYYANHRFYDFRSLSQYQGVPSVITNESGTTTSFASSDFFTSDDWNSVWSIVHWNNSADIASGDAGLMINSPNNIYIEQNTDESSISDTYLTMRTARLPDFQTAAEIDSVSTSYQFLSIRMLARTTGSPGAVTAMFTFRAADSLGQTQEADLEIRTKDPRNTIQYTNQPSYATNGDVIKQATQNATMPYGLDWTDWAVHRLDWSPTRSTWYVDGEQVADISFQTPRNPSQVILNCWSDGGSWSGNMSLYDEAYLNIQWLEMVFNSTEPVASWTDSAAPGPNADKRMATRASKGCKSVCSIDNTTDTGVATELWSAAPGRLALGDELLSFVALGITVVALLLSTPAWL